MLNSFKKIFFWAVILVLINGGTISAREDNLGALYKLVDNFIELKDKLPTASESFWSWAPFTADDRGQIQNDINCNSRVFFLTTPKKFLGQISKNPTIYRII